MVTAHGALASDHNTYVGCQLGDDTANEWTLKQGQLVGITLSAVITVSQGDEVTLSCSAPPGTLVNLYTPEIIALPVAE